MSNKCIMWQTIQFCSYISTRIRQSTQNQSKLENTNIQCATTRRVPQQLTQHNKVQKPKQNHILSGMKLIKGIQTWDAGPWKSHKTATYQKGKKTTTNNQTAIKLIDRSSHFYYFGPSDKRLFYLNDKNESTTA